MPKALTLWALVLSALVAVACEAVPLSEKSGTAPGTALDLQPPDGWALAHSIEEERDRSASLWLRRDESRDAWTQRIALRSWTGKGPGEGSLRRLLDRRMSQFEMSCPDALTWRVLEDHGHGLLYEMVAEPCLGFAAHHMVGYLMETAEGRHDLSYIRKGGVLAEGPRHAWLAWVRRLQSTAAI